MKFFNYVVLLQVTRINEALQYIGRIQQRSILLLRKYGKDPTESPRTESRVNCGPDNIEIDDLFYLRDQDDPRTQSQMASEERFATEQLSKHSALEKELAEEIANIASEAQQVSPWKKYGEYEWRARGTDEYPIWEARHCSSKKIAQVLDENVAPVSLPSEFMPGVRYNTFVSGVSCCVPSPSGQLLAYTVDATGDESYVLQFTGVNEKSKEKSQRLNQAFQETQVDAEVRWGQDDSEIFVLQTDATSRPFELWRLHESGDHCLLYREDDLRFRLQPPLPEGIFLSQSRNATEILGLKTKNTATVLVQRESGNLITAVDGNVSSFVYLRGNQVLFYSPNDVYKKSLKDAFSLDNVRLCCDKNICLVSGLASDSTRAVWWRKSSSKFHRLEMNGFSDIEMLPYEGSEPLFELSSPIRFPQIARLNISTMELKLVQARELTQVEKNLSYERIKIQNVPVVLTLPSKKVIAVLLRAYGAYGACHPTHLEPATAALASKGVVIAVAGVRGGGELGSSWREDGRGALKKNNSAIDVMNVAKGLLSEKKFPQIVAWGRSAGGLSVCGAVHRAPELFSAVLLDVPFLDPLGTLADETLPLTVNEWEEFGNPRYNFNEIKAYSPTSQVAHGERYPPMLLRPALRDARTGFWESYKFAARVRASADASKIIVAADDRGHFPPSSINGAARDVAKGLAFLLSQIEERSPSFQKKKVPSTIQVKNTQSSHYFLDSAAELRTSIFSSHLESQGSIYLQNRAYRDELADAASAPLILNEDNQVIASACAHALVSASMPSWYISSVAVHEDHRRRGFADILANLILCEAEKKGIYMLFLHVAKENIPAIKPYEKFGFSCSNNNVDYEVFTSRLIEEFDTHVSAQDTSQQLMVLELRKIIK